MRKIKKFNLILVLSLLMVFILPVTAVWAEDTSIVNTQLLNDINALRSSQGLGGLSMDNSLTQVAATRAQEASTVWSHTRPNGTQGISMLPSNKWRGENLAYVQYGSFTFTPGEQQSAASLMFSNLKASPTHYNNMVFGHFTKIGIYTYVTQTGTGYKLTTAMMFSN